MGFDLSGQDPKNKKGEYFRNNCCWWRPLWEYIAKVCDDIITDEDFTAGGYNDGHLIDKEKAVKIANRLEQLLVKKEVQKYSLVYAKRLKELPKVECDLCKGTGIRDDEYIKGKCNGCNGLGKRNDSQLSYPFSVENVREFAKFCKNSRGFTIC